MMGPCMCGDPYCASCGDPGAIALNAALESLADHIMDERYDEVEFELFKKTGEYAVQRYREHLTRLNANRRT